LRACIDKVGLEAIAVDSGWIFAGFAIAEIRPTDFASTP
jgi:hypothetical protein